MISFHLIRKESLVNRGMYMKTCLINLVSPHLAMVACNMLTVRFFVEDRYTPSLITLIENTGIHGVVSMVVTAIAIKELRKPIGEL